MKAEVTTSDANGALEGYGARLFLDGREIKDLLSVTFSAHVGDIMTVQTEVLVTERLHFEGEIGRLEVLALVSPGYELIERDNGDGTKSYTAKEITE